MPLFFVAATALAAQVLSESSDELLSAADDLTDLRPGWVVLAVALEALCYLSRGSAQRRLLVSGTADLTDEAAAGGSARVGTLVLAGTTMAGDAVAYCLPLGFAAAGVVTMRVLRRRAVSQVVAGWMFGVATLLYVAVLCVLAVIAAQLAGADGPAGLQEVSVILFAVLVAVLGLFLAARRWPDTIGGPLRWLAGRTAAVSLPARLRTPLVAFRRALRSWWAQIRLLRLAPAAVALASVETLVSWSCDIGVLAASYAALGAVPPWTGLLLAYCAGQIVSSVPLTPGGIGVVEGSLTLALVAFGGSTETTLAAVLLYRLISHWAVIPAGGAAWLALRFTEPGRRAVGTEQPALAVDGGLR